MATPPAEARPAQDETSAEAHYFRGNRFYELQLWERATAEWRRASQLWHPPPEAGPRRRRWFGRWQAVLALVITAVIVHQLLFVLFPRDSFELMLMGNRQQQTSSWWERWLDSGRPRMGQGHKITVREWWSRFKDRMRGVGREEEELARNGSPRPSISQRWAELLRRYGKWGPLVTWDLDYAVISGNGLSRLGEYEDAVAILERRIGQVRKQEKLADLYQSLANAHYYRGYGLEPGGTATYDLAKVRKAAKAYEKSLGNQVRPLSHGNLGWMYLLLGEYKRSERHSLKALGMNGRLHYVRLNLGLLYLLQHRNRDAFEAYYTVISRNPGQEVFLGGITDLKEVVRDSPGQFPFAYMMIGLLSLQKGDLIEGRDALSRFLSGPSQGAYWDRIAKQLLKRMHAADLER